MTVTVQRFKEFRRFQSEDSAKRHCRSI